MKSNFKRALHQFLEQERISIESDIVNELTYRMIGIKTTEEDSYAGFNLKDSYYANEEDKEKIFFSIPQGCDLTQIYRILDFFKIPPSEFKYNKPLTLNNKFVLEVFVPRFIEYFQYLKAQDPQPLNLYRIGSAFLLESTAIATLKKYTEEAKDILLKKKLEKLPESYIPLVNFISLLSKQIEDIELFPLFYMDILESAQKIDSFKTMPEIAMNRALVSTLNKIQEGIQLYGKYHRNKSVLDLIAFQEEQDTLFTHLRIDKESTLLEKIILDIANSEGDTLTSAAFAIGDDPSRMTLRYDGLSKANVKKLITYMQKLGDETCCEGYGYKHNADPLAFSTQERAVGRASSRKRKLPDSHSIEIDGSFFYTIIFPRVKERLNQMAEHNLLAPYQQAQEQSEAQESEDESERFNLSSAQPIEEPLAIRVSSVSMFPAEEKIAQPRAVKRAEQSNSI